MLNPKNNRGTPKKQTSSDNDSYSNAKNGMSDYSTSFYDDEYDLDEDEEDNDYNGYE